MCKALSLALLLAVAPQTQSPKYHGARAPSSDEIKAWDISIPPDGKGLPEGKGSAVEGKALYESRCQKCHGAKGEGGDYEHPIAAGKHPLKTPKPIKSVGSFWPYATTVWDYINRSMPFDQPGLLKPAEVYAVVAYILNLNGIIGNDGVMDAKSLPKVKMPNRDGFVADPRPDVGSKTKH